MSSPGRGDVESIEYKKGWVRKSFGSIEGNKGGKERGAQI